MPENPGIIEIIDDSISYRSRTFGSWEMKLSEIAAIGEFTTNEGPYAEDYFIVFVRSDLSWYEAPRSADNFDSVLNDFSNRVQTKFDLKLTYSTQRESRVLWPIKIEGAPLLVTPFDTGSFWERLLIRFGLRNCPVSLGKELTDLLRKSE